MLTPGHSSAKHGQTHRARDLRRKRIDESAASHKRNQRRCLCQPAMRWREKAIQS